MARLEEEEMEEDEDFWEEKEVVEALESESESSSSSLWDFSPRPAEKTRRSVSGFTGAA